MADYFIQERMLKRWIHKKNRLDDALIKAFEFRQQWDKQSDRKTLQNCLNAIGKSAFKNYGISKKRSIVSQKRNYLSAKEALGKWRDRFRELYVEKRLAKHLAFKALKTELDRSKQFASRLQTKRSHWQKRQVVTAWKQFIRLQTRVEGFKQRLDLKRTKDILLAIKVSLKDGKIEALTERNSELERQLRERVLATQNTTLLYQQRISQLENQVIETER